MVTMTQRQHKRKYLWLAARLVAVASIHRPTSYDVCTPARIWYLRGVWLILFFGDININIISAY